MPAPTPSTMRAGMFPARRQGSGLGRLHGGQQPPPDLAERDRQGLLLHAGLDQRPDVLQQALAELGVVGVDLPRPLGRHDDEAVLAIDDVEQVVDGRVGDAVSSGIPCHRLPSVKSVFRPDQAVIKATSCSHTSLTDVLTSVMSNSWPASISLAASSSRRAMTSGGSVPRAERRRTSSSQEGGARKTRSASGTARRTCLAPSMSISSSAGTPAAMRRVTGSRGVP